jgi:copper(I)-binding protein
MKKFLALITLGILFLSACALTGEEEGTGVEIHDPWARAAAKGENGAAYLLIHNHSTLDDAVLGASTDAADAAEIHLSQEGPNGVMQMSPQISIPLPADSELEFKPGSYHIMLVNLKHDLKKGDGITITIHFQFHEDIVVQVPVYDATEMGGAGMDMNMHDTPAP